MSCHVSVPVTYVRTPPPPLPLDSSTLVIRMQYTSSIGVVNCFSHTLPHRHLQPHSLLYLPPPSSSDDPYRVRLTMFPGVEGSDYINSTYMDVSKAQTSVTLTLIVFVIIISIL